MHKKRGAATSGGTATPQAARPGGKTPALDQFTVNLTAKAKAGMDPVIGRDAEIRQVIDILTRRRQNNPILTGEAGVGKTAVVGRARRSASRPTTFPNRFATCNCTRSTSIAQAGGWRERRIREPPEVNVIDAGETLADADHPVHRRGPHAHRQRAAGRVRTTQRNLPEARTCARGERRTIAATTFAEYKKYFETDAALKRRFQQVKIDEPDEQKADPDAARAGADARKTPQGAHPR